MKRILFIFFLIPLISFPQNQNSIWVFGDSAGIDFTIPTNPVSITTAMNGRGSCASLADSLGQLLFYSWNLSNYDDSATFVNNAIHDTMKNGSRLTGGDLYNQIQILPFEKINKFYIFHLGILTTNGLYYSVIDMTQDNGNGAVVQKNVQLSNLRSGDCLTTVKHGNGRDWWVISKLSTGTVVSHLNRFFVYLVTSDSINAPVMQDFNDATDADFQKVIWHPSGDKFMLINVGGYMSEFSFDRCNGNIALIRNVFTEQSSNYSRLFWEGSYSPSGNIFYVNTNYWFNVDTAYLLQLNLLSPNIVATIDTIDKFTVPIGTGAPRLAPDNKIYISRAYLINFPGYPYPDSVRNYINENLSVINSPDSFGSACNYQPFSFYLGGKRTYYGLPNNPNYDLGPLVGSFCDTLSIGIATHSTNEYLTAFPNPFNNKIRFDLEEHEKYRLVIADLTGKKVYETMQQGKAETDLSFLHQGLYITTLSNEKYVYQVKIIKQ